MAGQPPGDPNQGYPPASYPPQAPGYPPQAPGYPPQVPGYPPQAPMPPGYPPQGAGYPPPGYAPYGYGYPQPAGGPVYATFARRFGALIIDSFCLAIVALIVGLSLHLPGFETTTVNGTTQFTTTNSGWSALVFGVIGAVYFIGCWTYLGATLAQKMLGLRVCRTSGPVALPIEAAAIRWVVLIGVSTAIGAVSVIAPDASGVVGLGQLAWLIILAVTTYQSPTHQGLHDQMAGSLVVHG